MRNLEEVWLGIRNSDSLVSKLLFLLKGLYKENTNTNAGVYSKTNHTG